MFSKDKGLRSSAKVEGTTSGARPCEVKYMGQENRLPRDTAYKDLEDLFAPWTIRGQNNTLPSEFVDPGDV
jgi:hypothetical protein